MASCERHEPSFVRKSLSALPGILLLTGVAVFSWFITPRLIALHPFMKSLNLSDFIVAIILGMVICNTVGVHAVFRDGLRFSTTLTKTGIVVMGCKYSFAGLIKTGSEAIIIISVFLFTSAIILMWLSRRLSMSPSLGGPVWPPACPSAGSRPVWPSPRPSGPRMKTSPTPSPWCSCSACWRSSSSLHRPLARPQPQPVRGLRRCGHRQFGPGAGRGLRLQQ